MGSVWKRLQRVNKRAAKFQFTASYHELHLETTAKWRPSNLAVVWTRRSRRVASAPLPWEPDMMNPLVGHIAWPVPDNHSISVTLFKDPRTHELEDKDWTFVIEDITPLGKKRVLASASINMRKYASIESTQQSFTLNLKPVSRKISSADLELTIHCVFLREGKATDEDMQSVVSLMSVNNNCDVAPLDDLEDIPDLESSNGDISDHLYDFTQQLEQMTTSLNGCIDLPTPLSDKQNSEGDDLLKTPSAAQPQTQQQQQQQTQQHWENKTITAELVETAPKEEKSIVATKKEKSIFKFVTSTPIDKTFEKKTAETASNLVSGVGASAGGAAVDKPSRRALNFKGATEIEPKQNGEAIKIMENKEDLNQTLFADQSKSNVSTTKTVTAEKESFNRTYTEKSTIAVADKMLSPTTNNSNSSNDDSKPKISANSTKNSKNNTINTTSSQPKVTPPTPTQTQTTTESKRADLQPLNLKKNYEHESSSIDAQPAAPTNQNNNNNNNSGSLNNTSLKPIEKIILKENTPGQDLLEWCKEVTRDYPNVKVTNLTTSWRNGMAFCAIIHHFEPSLVDMSKLSAHDVVGNCRTAFDAAESLGIPRVIEPRDMSLLAVPDKLAVMTYLHQLRAHFTGKQLQIEQIGPTSDESSYVIGNYKSDNLSQNMLNLSHLKAQLLHQNSLDDDIYGTDKPQLSPIAKKDVKNIIYSGSKSILGKVLSPTKDKNSINASQHSNLSLSIDAADTNGAEDSEKLNAPQEQVALAPTTPTILDPNTANRILSRHKEMSEKAKMMMGKTKFSNGERNETDEERQQRLHEQARRLILETRIKTTANGGGSNYDSPTTPTKLKRMNFSPERTISPIHNGYEDFGISVSGSGTPKMPLSPVKKITPPRDIETTTSNNTQSYNNTNTNNSKISPSHRISERFNGSSPLQSFNAVMDRISPKAGDRRSDKLSYIESELEALEREQEAIDQKASSLEKKLRAVMGGNPKSEETEEQLLSQWFTLVNKKNALLRRQMQLNILEQESDLQRKHIMLNQELRAAQSVEDWRKTEAQREKERLLLEELVAIVDKRDQLVQQLHNEEIAIEDDHEIARELEQVDISGGKEKCSIQ